MAKKEKTSTQTPNRIISLLFVFAVSVGIVWWQVGNPIEAIINIWKPVVVEVPTSIRTETLPNITKDVVWQQIRSHGNIPIDVLEQGRSNPFNGAAPESSSQQRDEQRLRDMRMLGSKLAVYKDTFGDYPSTSGIMLGGYDASCLTEDGWLSDDDCTKVEVEPFLDQVPADPGNYNYYYQLVNGDYAIEFRLEEDWGEIVAGLHSFTPTGIQ